MESKEILAIKGVSYSFRDERGKRALALTDMHLSVHRGEFLSLAGPSGCGKSTLLHIIAGLITEDAGTVVRSYDRLAMVFQSHAIFPWLSVLDNVAFGLHMQGMKRSVREKIAREKIEEVGLHGYEKHLPHELSGGQRQRVSIARALAVSPDLLLMDEPFSSLDSITAQALKDDILHIWEKYKITIVMVNHLIPDAIELSDRIMVMSRKPGTVLRTVHIPLPRPRMPHDMRVFSLTDDITTEIRNA